MSSAKRPRRESGTHEAENDFLEPNRRKTQTGSSLNKVWKSKDVIVLGRRRGGEPVAFEIATMLKARLDVLLVRKLGVPGQKELALGAFASEKIRCLDPMIVNAMGLSELDIEPATQSQRKEMERRERVYRSGSSPLIVKGMTIIFGRRKSLKTESVPSRSIHERLESALFLVTRKSRVGSNRIFLDLVQCCDVAIP